MEPPALAAGPAAPVRAAPGASADLVLPPPTGTKPFTYHWSRAGASLDDRFTTSDDAGGVRLTVSAAQTGDSGVYTLQASNAAGSDTSKIRLEVSAEEAPTGEDPPTFLRRLQDLTVKVGSRTRFLVEIISSTECKVTWYRNERRLLEAERVALARDGNFWCADVAAVSVDDAGRWTCTAENAGGRASCSAHLNVLVPKAYKRPEFVEELRALLTEQGTVSLECKVVGVPTPVLRWFKDSREIKAGDVFALTANAEDPTSLGTYTCEAVNCMGRAYSSSKVHVVGRASREGSARPSSGGLTPEPPPIFTKELEDAHVKICEHLTLGCHVVVPPWPRSVVWYNKEGKIEPGERYHTLEDGVGGYLLEIPSVEWADEGEWKCVATSAGGRVGITTCYVAMDVPKNYRKPRFMENLQAVLTEEGLVSFECKVVGFPTPVLSWFKDGQELKPGDVYQLTGTNSLGSYCCIAKNCMGQASSSAELTVEDIQNQLNEEEKLQLFSKNQAPKFLQGLKSVEAKIDEPFRFTVKVAIPPEPSVLWYRDDQPVDESTRCHLEKEEKGIFNLDIQNLEFLDQAEWKCVAMNDFGHSVTSCFLKLIIPRHYKKPRFLENLQAILSDEGAVNLECKVIGVPQPVLKWYKDGEELKPGDIHRIISGQDGTCCLGTYTCEAQNCMGIAASSASLLGFDDSMKTKTKAKEEQPLHRNLSLSTIHEERTSQMYDTPVGDITLDDKGEISFSFDGKEVSVSLYETPDLTEEEALQIVEMYADQLSENVTEHNVVELPPLRFVKETSTSGNLLMEAIIIDVSPDYFATPEEDLRTEADVEDLSIADENGLPQLSLDQEIDIGGEDYLEKTMALMSEERSDFAAKSSRRKSDSQRSADDFFSLSRDQSLSEEKRDDDTHISESELQSFASARSSAKIKSKSSKKSGEEGHETSEPTKTILLKDEIASKSSKNELTKQQESESDVPIIKPKRERRTSRSSRRSSTSSEKSIGKSREELLRLKSDLEQTPSKPLMSDEEFITTMNSISTSLTKVINDVQLIERDIILKSELMSSAATASRSLEIISSLIKPLSEIHSIAEAAKESVSESKEVTGTIFNSVQQPLKTLQQSLTIVEKCIDMESDNKTLVKKTCVAFIETCGIEVQNILADITSVTAKDYIKTDDKVVNEIDSVVCEMTTAIKFSVETIKTRNILSEAREIKPDTPTLETKHLKDTQKAIFELKSPLNSLLRIVESAQSGNIIDLSKIKHSEVIMNDMSASIQDLQTALEQIESLSVKETLSTLHKHNTEIIETVMDSVIKLRSSFEQLSTETNTEQDKTMLEGTLSALKENLTEISNKIETIDKDVGKFDILQSENKLDVLQKMAQTLIALENNLPRLESMPTVKSHMDVFHKNLTKVLEKIIESNDAEKYQTMMEICDIVSIMNGSIRNIDSVNTEDVLPLASLSNTLKIIQTNLISNIIESELNCRILNNISDVLVDIQEAINKAEDNSVQIDSEYIQDLSSQILNEEKVNIIIEHINQTIAAINTVKTIESTQELKSTLTPALEYVCPILEELRKCVASVRSSGVEQDEHISEIPDASFAQTIATPLCELNQSIIILNQLIAENIDYIKDNTEIITAIAEPLHELHTTLEILQQDVVSQYREDLTPYEVSINMASVVQNLQSCIVMIHEQAGVEGAEDMSTLEDISGIKTSADTLPSDRLVLPIAEETAIEQSYLSFNQEVATTATANTLQSLNEHIMVLQTPDIIEALDTLSEISDYASLKSVIVNLGDLHTGIEGILHPVPIEGSMDLDDTTNITKLAAIAEPMHEIQQSLSILDTSNIPVYENIIDLPSDKIHSVFQSISELKNSLEQCMCAVLPAMEIANNTIEISNKVSTLREVCEQLKEIFDTSKDASNEIALPKEVQSLETVVNNLIDATDVSKDIRIDQVKSITEELYLKVMDVQEDIIQFTAQSPEQISQEAKLIHIVNEVETNIAVLEQYDFIDLSLASNLTSCMSPQLAVEIDSESLAQLNDIAESAVNVLQDADQEIPIADLLILEDFFKTCKNEFTIFRCLITKAASHKKIIRLLQEFNSLQSLINNFTTQRLELHLTDDVNECLSNFLIHADDCLRNARHSLINVVDTQLDILINIPINQLESTRELKDTVENKTGAIFSVIEILLQVAEITKHLENTLHNKIVEEISNPNQITKFSQEEILLGDKIEEIAMFVQVQTDNKSMDYSSANIFEELLKCINKHNYKDALGTGKTLIILKCLAQCSTIVQEEVSKKKVLIKETTEINAQENTLKGVLAEMLQPLQALQNELVNIQEQVMSNAEEDSTSIDITTTESIMQTMTELHKDILHQLEADNSTLLNEDIPLLQEVDKEVHTIRDSIRTMDNAQAAQAVKDITKPIEDIEKALQAVLTAENVSIEKEALPKEVSAEIIDNIDQYIDLVEIIEEISAVIKLEDVKETFKIARELKESISLNEKPESKKLSISVCAEQARLAQKLQAALSVLQLQVLDSTQKLAPAFNIDSLERIVQVTELLQANLVAVTSLQTSLQAQALSSDTTKSTETANELSFSSTAQVDKIEVKNPEQVEADGIEPIDIISPEVMKVEEVILLEQQSSVNLTNAVPSRELIHIESTKTFDAEVINTPGASDAMTESSSDKTSEISKTVAVETTIVAEIDDNQKETIFAEKSTGQDNLMQHIIEYVSEDIVEVVDMLSSVINVEEIKYSINIANELRECIAATEIDTTEEYVGELKKPHDQQMQLIQSFETALSTLSKQTFENLQELVTSDSKANIDKITVLIENLKTDLESVKISQPVLLQCFKKDQKEVIKDEKLRSETMNVEEEILQQLNENVMETQAITEDSIISALSIPETDTVVIPESIGAKQSESINVTQDSLKKPNEEDTEETNSEIKELHDETNVAMPLESEKKNVEIPDQALITKSAGISQQVSFKESIADEILIQEENSVGNAQIATAGGSKVKGAVIVSEMPEQELATDIASSEKTTPEDEHITETSKADIKEVEITSATVTTSVTELVTPQFEQQLTEAFNNAAEDTLIQNINLFLSDSVLHTICKQHINLEEFENAVQIARELNQFLITSQLKTPGDLLNVVRHDFDQTNLIQLQQVLSSIQVQLFDKVSEASPSQCYDVQGAANVILNLTYELTSILSAAMLIETQEKNPKKVDIIETHNEPFVEDIYTDDYSKIKVSEDDVSYVSIVGKSIIPKEQIIKEATDEFVDCSSEDGDYLKQKNSIEVNVPETTETTTTFEEFFDSSTIADELLLAELIATEVREMNIFERTKNIDSCCETTESAKIISDSLTTAATGEINTSNVTEMKNIDYHTTEMELLHSDLDKPLVDVGTTQINFYKDASNQGLVTLENMIVYNEAESVLQEVTEKTCNKVENTNFECLPLESFESIATIVTEDESFENKFDSDDNMSAVTDVFSSTKLDVEKEVEQEIPEDLLKVATEYIKSSSSSVIGDLVSTNVTEVRNEKYYCDATLATHLENEKTLREMANLDKSQNTKEGKNIQDEVYRSEHIVADVLLEEPVVGAILSEKGNVEEVILDIDISVQERVAQSRDAESNLTLESAFTDLPKYVEETSKILNEAENHTEPAEAKHNNGLVPTVTNTVKKMKKPTDDLLQVNPMSNEGAVLSIQEDLINASTDEVIPSQSTEQVKVATFIANDGRSCLAVLNEIDINEVTEARNKEYISDPVVAVIAEVEIPFIEAISSSSNTEVATSTQENDLQENLVLKQNVETVQTHDKCAFNNILQQSEFESSPVHMERRNLIEHIDEFIAEEIVEVVDKTSNITNLETLKESISLAKKLRECLVATDFSATAEETTSLKEKNILERAKLAKTLHDALSSWQIQALDSAEIIAPLPSSESLQRVSEVILHLQDDLGALIVSDVAENLILEDIGDVAIFEQNSITQLETLLREVNMKINPADRNTEADDSESLRDALDEVQTVIIKLKSEYDGAINDTLNETLEDLECSVRSVQLQINEESPPELLNEACATLQLLVENMNAAQQVQATQILLKSETTEIILDKCSKETEETVNLLDFASKLDVEIKGSKNLTSIVNSLKTIRDNVKTLRESFLVNADTVIENGVKVVEYLNQIEENIFSLEREIEMAENITMDTRDSIITAVHSVYGSISNMRSTVSSVQKRFMFENFGSPSESLLHSIKNISVISSNDDESNKASWKKLSKSLRKVLNHFEDIKFYINLDKTARLPSDAAFTKIILEELKDNIFSVLVPRAMLLDSNVLQKVNNTLKSVETNLSSIESDSTLQVKNKIPMFKNIASEMLSTTTFIKNHLEVLMAEDKKITQETEAEEQHKESKSLEEKQTEVYFESLQAIASEEDDTKVIRDVTIMESQIETQSSSLDVIELESKDIIKTDQSTTEKSESSTTVQEYNTSAQLPTVQEDQIQNLCKTDGSQTLEKPVDDVDAEEVAGSMIHENKNQESLAMTKDDQGQESQVQCTAEAEKSVRKPIEVSIKETRKECKDTTDLARKEEADEAASSSSGFLTLKRNDKQISSDALMSDNKENTSEDSEVTGEKLIEQNVKNPLMLMQKGESPIQEEEEKETTVADIKQTKEEACALTKRENAEQRQIENEIEQKKDIEVEKLDANLQKAIDTENEKEELKYLALKENVTVEIEHKLNEEVLGEQEKEYATKSKHEDLVKQNEEGILAVKEDTNLKEETETGIKSEKSTEEVEEVKTEHKIDMKQKDEEISALKKNEDLEVRDAALKETKESCADQEKVADLKQTQEEARETRDQVEIEKVEKDAELMQLYSEEDNCKEDEDVKLKRRQEEVCVKQEKKGDAEKAKKEADTKQKEEEALALKDEANADLKQKEEEARILKEKADAELKQKAEEERVLKEKADADKLKQKEEEARILKEKVDAELKQNEKEAHVLKEKADAELKQKEEEARVLKEKADAGLKQKKEETQVLKEKSDAVLKQEEARVLKDKEDADAKQMEEEALALKDEADAELTQKGEEARILKEKANIQLKQNEEVAHVFEEKAVAELKQKEEEARVLKEKTDAELKQKKEETEVLKEKSDAVLKQEEARVLKDKEDADAKQKEEESLALKDEADAELTQKGEEARIFKEKADAKLKQKKAEARVLKEKADAELKQKEEEARGLKEKAYVNLKQEEEDARVLKGKADAELKQKEEEARVLKEKTYADLKQKEEDARVLKDKADADLKQKEVEARVLKEKKDAEVKQKEEEAWVLKEKADAELAQKEKTARDLKETENADPNQKEEEARVIKEKVETEKLKLDRDASEKATQDAEFKEKEKKEVCALKENEDADLKQKEADVRLMKEEAKKVKIEKAEKAKQEADIKQKEEEERVSKEKAEVDLKHEDKERASKEKADTEFKQKEVDARVLKGIADAEKLKEERDASEKAKQDAELKQREEEETRALKEKADGEKMEQERNATEKAKQDAEFKQTKKEEVHALKEKDDVDQKAKKEADVKQKEEEARVSKNKLEAELKQEDEARISKEKTDTELKQKEKHARDLKEKAKAEKLKEERDASKKAKQDAELKQKEEEEARVLKEKADEEKLKQERDFTEKAKQDIELKQKDEEEVRALKNKDDVDQKAKKVADVKQKEKEERVSKEKAEVELKQKEDQARILKEKADVELKQKEEDARLLKETAEAEKLKEEIDASEKAKQDAELKQREEDEARVLKEKADAEKMEQERKATEKAKQDAELKNREEEEARVLKEKADAEKLKQVRDATEKAKQDAEIKQKEEKEVRALKEKEDADLKQKEADARIKKEKAKKAKIEKAEKAKQEADIKQKEEEERVSKEKTEIELKQKEDEARILKENADVELKQKEKDARLLKETAEAEKLKEERDASKKAKQDAELKQREEEEARVLKEKADEEKLKQERDTTEKAKQDIELKQKEEEEVRALKEKEDADLKQKEADARIKKEKAKKAKIEKAEKAKQEADIKQKEEEERVSKEKAEVELKQKEDQARILKEKADVELKQKEEDARLLKETAEAEKLKEEIDASEKAKQDAELKQREEDEARVLKEKADAEKMEQERKATEKAKQDAELKNREEEEARVLKEKADAEKLKQVRDATEKAKQDAEIKQKEEKEVRALKEKEDAALKQKEADARIKKEKAKKSKIEKAEKAKQDADIKQKEEEERVSKEKAEIELKQKEDEARILKEKAEVELKQKEENARLLKEKEDAERQQKEDEARILKDKADAQLRHKEEKTRAQNEKEKAEKIKQDAEIKQREKEKADAVIKQKEEEARVLKEKEETDIQLREEEARIKKEKAKKGKIEKEEKIKKESSVKQKEEEARVLKEKADAELKHTEGESLAQKEKVEAEKTEQEVHALKDKVAVKISKQPKKEKEQTEQKQNQDKEARIKSRYTEKEDKVIVDKIKDKVEQSVPYSHAEKKEIMSHDAKETTKKSRVDEISKKSTKYTERLDESERRDDELHIYKSDMQTKKENGDISKSNRDESDAQHYIKEYQYEPSRTAHKLEAKERPKFVDHNHRDYTMEFARPSGYRERSFDVDKSDSLTSHDYLGRNAAIFRAQTLVLDSQLRSSTPLLLDPNTSRTSEPPERRSEVRHRSKAHSEARTITSEKRTSASRDSRRKPVFSTYLTDRTAVEGSRVKLTCSVLSSSDPSVTWYKNGVLLDNKLKYRTKYIDGLITLEVLNAVPSDSAEYSCTIQNENGSINSSANLKVYPSFEASPIPPTFTRSIRDTYHLAENELVLECRIRGQPLPTITWLKDNKSISNNSRYQAYYLADGVCRLAIEHPTPEDSGKYTCKAENSVWSDQITHVVNFTGQESRQGPNIATIEKSRFNRQAMESRRPHFTNVLSDFKVVTGGTIGLQVEIRGAPTRVEWLREGCSVTEVYRNAKTFVEQGLYTLALSDVTEKESGMYTCRAWSSQCHVDMNAAITVVQPNELDGKPAIIVGRPEKDILISIGEDVNISFRVQGEPKPKVVFMKGIRDITTSQRVCKMTSDDYVKFTLKRSVISDAGTYCILARNAYGVDRAFVTVVVRQRASSDNLISDWTYPADDSSLSIADRKYKSVPERIPGEPCVLEGGNNWISLGWPKSEPGQSAPVLAYKVESWLLGKDGGARWCELGITPLNSFDAFNLKQGEEYHFRVTPRNRYGWGESVQTSSPISVGLAGDRPEFTESLPGQLKVLVGETANLSCSVKGTPAPEVVWMKNGHEIEDEDRRLSSAFNGFNCSLTIKDINIEDEARYSCEATNLHGRASTYARLAVVTDRSIWEADAKLKRERSADVDGDYPPQFTMRLRDRRVQATYPVRLTCQVIGSPDPRITWFKDSLEIKPDNRRSHFQDEHFHTLEIAPTNLEDGGVYEAMARNSSGAVSCRCNLVVDKGIRAYVAPEFCCGLEPLYRLTDGEELRISAVVEAYPSVGVTWYRDGVRLRPSRRAIMTLDRDGQIELALAAVTSRDAGVYSCTASNEVGRASTSGKVEVIGSNVTRTPPVFISPDEPYSKEPMFIRKPRSSEAREGDTVIIACEVVGDPKPDVYWLRDFLKPDYYRDSSHFKRMGEGPEYRFEIPHAKLDYTGAYSVVARNTHGEAKAIISLQILAKDPTSSDEHNIRYGRVEVLPRFSKDLTDLLSCDGDAVEFECHLSGNPEPNVRWFHYQELIRDCPDFETSFEDGAARLKIKQVTAEDEGTYTCEAANNLGKVTSSACLVVYPPGEPNTLSQRLRRPPAFLSAASTPRSTPRSTPARSVSRTPGPETRRLCSPARTLAPSFYTYPFNKVAEEGDTVTLQCAIKGNPAPWATWDKDGVIITPSSRITIKEKDDVLRVLEIEQVTVDDVGVYRITIENEFGRQEASARIEVITQKGKFYAGVRAVSPSPRKSLTYHNRRPSTPRQD